MYKIITNGNVIQIDKHPFTYFIKILLRVIYFCKSRTFYKEVLSVLQFKILFRSDQLHPWTRWTLIIIITTIFV